ncbi:hypothetical protein CHCC20335_2265 [Bacillus paralicheniformis]|nr:hypothetical protein CHCC20335_2265 [Bacillus paralicheniformis]
MFTYRALSSRCRETAIQVEINFERTPGGGFAKRAENRGQHKY